MIKNEAEKQRVISYLTKRLEPLTIESQQGKADSVLKLSSSDSLIGRCWESTQTCSLFFEDGDFIERGVVALGNDPFYYHSWICFSLDGQEYVFDPALNHIAKKELFYQKLNPRVRSRVSVKQVKDYFLKFISDPKMRETKLDYQRKMYKTLDVEFIKQLEENNTIWGTGDMADPFFAGIVSYNPKLEGTNIKKLDAHFHSFIIH